LSNRDAANRRASIYSGKSGNSNKSKLNYAPEVIKYLQDNIDHLDFDVWKFRDISSNEELCFVAYYLLDKNDFFDLLNIDSQTFINFIRKI